MADEKQDLRVQKTRHALAMAMLSLLETKSFAKITVNDLCLEALVSRSAFYVHFADKYALLGYCMEMLRQNVFEETAGGSFREKIRAALEKIKDNSRTFKNLVLAELDMELIEMLRASFSEEFQRLLLEKKPPDIELPGPPEIIAVYYSAGIANTILYWVSRNMPYSVDEMAQTLCALLPGKLDACQ